MLDNLKKESIVNGFRACGLYPLNADAVDYTKCLDVIHEPNEPSQPSNDCEARTPSIDEYRSALRVLNHELRGRASSHEVWEEIYATVQAKVNNEGPVETAIELNNTTIIEINDGAHNASTHDLEANESVAVLETIEGTNTAMD